MLKQSYFLIMIKVADEAIQRNYLKDLRWISENLHLVTLNTLVDRWNSLSECCVTCNSINCFKSHISSKLEQETI